MQVLASTPVARSLEVVAITGKGSSLSIEVRELSFTLIIITGDANDVTAVVGRIGNDLNQLLAHSFGV